MRAPGIDVGAFLYAQTVRWYPPALRIEFGDDMVAVFTENMESCWQRGGWRSVARAWLAVGRDVVSIVVPYRLGCALPVVAAVCFSIVFYGSVLAAIDPNRHCHK